MTEDSAIRIDLHSAEVVHFTHKIRNTRRDQHDKTYPCMRMPDRNHPFDYPSTVNSRWVFTLHDPHGRHFLARTMTPASERKPTVIIRRTRRSYIVKRDDPGSGVLTGTPIESCEINRTKTDKLLVKLLTHIGVMWLYGVTRSGGTNHIRRFSQNPSHHHHNHII